MLYSGGNCIFLKIDSNQTSVKTISTKYHRGSVAGIIFDGIVTYEEVLQSCPGCTGFNSLQEAMKSLN